MHPYPIIVIALLTWAGGSDTTVQSREAFDLLDTDSTFGEDWANVGGQACNNKKLAGLHEIVPKYFPSVTSIELFDWTHSSLSPNLDFGVFFCTDQLGKTESGYSEASQLGWRCAQWSLNLIVNCQMFGLSGGLKMFTVEVPHVIETA